MSPHLFAQHGLLQPEGLQGPLLGWQGLYLVQPESPQPPLDMTQRANPG